MRFFSFAAVAALSAATMGQGISDIPKCAQACFASSLGTCGATDFACICGNTAVIDKVSCCIFATCPQADIAVTTQLAASLCKLANVVVNTAPVCAAPSSAAMSTSPAGLASATPSMSPAGSGSVTPSGSATSSVGNGTASATGDSSSPTASYAVSTGAASSQSADTKFGLGVVVAGLLAVL